jgi:rubredoxin
MKKQLMNNLKKHWRCKMITYDKKDFKEALEYYWKVYDENNLGMLARHYYDVLREAVDKANKHDEKETPKKVVLHYKHHLGTAWGTFVSRITCPSCNRRLKDKIPNNQLFCPRCGQKLDWSDK